MSTRTEELANRNAMAVGGDLGFETAAELRRLADIEHEHRALLANEQNLREELEALKASLGEPVAWMVTNGKTFRDRAFMLEVQAKNSMAERKDDCKIAPLYALTNKDQS